MKIKVKELKPNPYRNMDKYPVDREKVEALKISINETDFWDNILARNRNGQIEIAYGHHRLIALKELKIEEIDIPVKDLDDSKMIRIMANENMDEWRMRPGVILETVRATRDFLNAELAKYETWEASNIFIKRFIDRFNFDKVKKQGVGQTTILKFLGGNWKQHTIQVALKSLDLVEEEILNEEAVTHLPSMEHLRSFTKNVEKGKISKEKQLIYAKEIKNEDIPKRQVDSFFADKKYKSVKNKNQKIDPKIQLFENVIAETTHMADQFSEKLKIIIKFKEEFNSDYYKTTIVRLRLLLSIKSLQEQFNSIININTKENEKSTIGEKNTKSIGG